MKARKGVREKRVQPDMGKGTKDKEKGFSCSTRTGVALLGDKFDAVLFTNAYAVIQAAKMCRAGALLVCDTTSCSRSLFAYGGTSEWHLRAFSHGKRSLHSL